MSSKKIVDASNACHGDAALYFDSLKRSSNSAALLEGMCTHDHIIRHVVADDTCLVNLLVHMYVNCGYLYDAEAVLKMAHHQNASTWNFLIAAFATQGDQKKAFKLFVKMQVDNVEPSKSTIVRLLSTCCSKTDLNKGIELHNFIRSSKLKMDVFVGTALVSMYGKCGNIENAWKTFNEMPCKDVVSFSVMMGILVRGGREFDAIQLLNVMGKEGLEPDHITYVCALDACNSPSLLEEGKKLHRLVKQSGYAVDVKVASALVNMYGKCGSVEAARRVFDEMPERNVVSWNSMLAVYVRHNQGKEAIMMLNRMMHENVIPDRITFVSAVDACAKHSLLTEGESIHGLIKDFGLDGDVILSNALLNMYGKCGELKQARAMFSKMHNKNVVSWNTMIALHSQHDKGDGALELLCQMQQEGIIADNATFACIFDACASCSAFMEGKRLHSCLVMADLEMDVFARSALVKMYGESGSLKEARVLFDRVIERDVVTWNTMLTLLIQHNSGSDALELFAQMQAEGVKPDNVTFTCLLDACVSSGFFGKGVKLQLISMSTGDHFDAVLGTALVYMYGKCGDIKGAVRVFEEVMGGDVIAWTAMIAMHAQHGQSKEALSLFLKMQEKGIKPDDVTLVSVLTACSHSGFFDEALHFFSFMGGKYSMLPATEHYVCMIDLFGRAGCLREAESIVLSMPSNTSAARFLSLLGACRYHVDVECGKRAARHVLEMEYDFASSYITISNIYAVAGQNELETKS